MILVMSEVVSLSCIRDGVSGLLFAVFQIFGILLPGTAGILLIGWKKELSWRACAFSFVLGYCISLFEYFIIMLLGLRLYVPYIVVVVATISGFYIYRKIQSFELIKDDEVRDSDTKVIWVFAGVIFLTALVASCFNNLVQPVVNESSPANDLMYWVGNIIELTKEFPPKDFTKYPNVLTYHYFSSAQLALISLFTKIRPIYMGLFFSVVQSVLLRVFCGYLVITKCTRELKLRIFGMIILFFSSGFEREVFITYLAHSYHAPFGVEYGLSIFLIFLYLLIIKSEEKTNRLKTSILIWACLFVLAGEKIPYGGIALLGLGILCIGFLFTKQYVKAFITGLPALAIFVVEYFTMINLSRFVNNPNSNGSITNFM